MRRHIVYGAVGAIAMASPAVAEDAAKEGRDAHPPTAIVGEEVPTMTGSDKKDKHPPTEIVGEEVPTMKDKDDKKQ